jgi:hypothetical protein
LRQNYDFDETRNMIFVINVLFYIHNPEITLDDIQR